MERDVTIDESLLLYKGKLGPIHYIPNKRARFGIKNYILCESYSGYSWHTIIYTGKDTKFADQYEDLSVSTRTVMTLMKTLYCRKVTDHLLTVPTDTYRYYLNATTNNEEQT